MKPPFLKRGDLGEIRYVSASSSGVVFSVPSLSASFSDGLLYKEFATEATALLDVPALASMPALLESLNRDLGLELLSKVGWPTRLVARQGGVCGYVTPTPPKRFYRVGPTSSSTGALATVESLISADTNACNTDDVLLRYAVLAELARTMTLLHELGIVVGRIAPASILFTAAPQVGVFLTEAEGMCVRGNVPLPPGRGTHYLSPPAEEKVGPASDVHLLGLLALQLLDPTVTHPGDASSFPLPQRVEDIIAASLSESPELRPNARAWSRILARAKNQTPRTATSNVDGTAPAGYRRRLSSKARAGLVGLLGLLLVAGVGGLFADRLDDSDYVDPAGRGALIGIRGSSTSRDRLTEPPVASDPGVLPNSGQPEPAQVTPSLEALEAATCDSLITLIVDGSSELLDDVSRSGTKVDARTVALISADIEFYLQTPSRPSCDANEASSGICDGILNYSYDNVFGQIAAIEATVSACRVAWEAPASPAIPLTGESAANATGWPLCQLIERLDAENEDDVAVGAFLAFASTRVPTEFQDLFQTATKIYAARAFGQSLRSMGVSEADSLRVTTAVSNFLEAECAHDG